MTLAASTLYAQAKSVQAQSGVDPAIIATIAQTESNLSLSPPFTLGITTAATRGGIGASGGTLGSHSPFAGSSQPAAFFSYQNGAEAAIAFGNYIRAYQPGLTPLLGDAQAFFNPAGPIQKSNYYVPTPGGTSTTAYYSNWQKIAANLTSTLTGVAPLPAPDVQLPGQTQAPGQTQGQGQTTVPSTSNPEQGGQTPDTGLINPNFGPSLLHLLIQILLVIIGVALIMGGVLVLKDRVK